MRKCIRAYDIEKIQRLLIHVFSFSTLVCFRQCNLCAHVPLPCVSTLAVFQASSSSLKLIQAITTDDGCIYCRGTFWRIIKHRSTEDFESLPYVCTLLNSSLWTYYGIIKPGAYLVATVNGFGIVVEIIYVSLFLIYAPVEKRVAH